MNSLDSWYFELFIAIIHFSVALQELCHIFIPRQFLRRETYFQKDNEEKSSLRGKEGGGQRETKRRLRMQRDRRGGDVGKF